LYALQGEIEAFCDKHVISGKACGYAQMMSEEVLVLQKDVSDISIMLSYSEKDGSLEMSCESTGAESNILEDVDEENEIGLMIIKARCNSVDYKYENGKNILTLKIKNEV
jgi:polar amino acid transport system ATP-binding protein